MEHFAGTAWHFGAIEAAAGIGMLIGGIALSLWGGFKRRIVTTQLGLVCLGVSIFLLGVTSRELVLPGSRLGRCCRLYDPNGRWSTAGHTAGDCCS